MYSEKEHGYSFTSNTTNNMIVLYCLKDYRISWFPIDKKYNLYKSGVLIHTFNNLNTAYDKLFFLASVFPLFPKESKG